MQIQLTWISDNASQKGLSHNTILLQWLLEEIDWKIEMKVQSTNNQTHVGRGEVGLPLSFTYSARESQSEHKARPVNPKSSQLASGNASPCTPWNAQRTTTLARAQARKRKPNLFSVIVGTKLVWHKAKLVLTSGSPAKKHSLVWIKPQWGKTTPARKKRNPEHMRSTIDRKAGNPNATPRMASKPKTTGTDVAEPTMILVPGERDPNGWYSISDGTDRDGVWGTPFIIVDEWCREGNSWGAWAGGLPSLSSLNDAELQSQFAQFGCIDPRRQAVHFLSHPS